MPGNRRAGASPVDSTQPRPRHVQLPREKPSVPQSRPVELDADIDVIGIADRVDPERPRDHDVVGDRDRVQAHHEGQPPGEEERGQRRHDRLQALRDGEQAPDVRDLVTNDIEVAVEGAQLDGMVCLTSCDKTVPGLLMGATSANLPAIFVSAGPMLRGNWRGQVLGSGSDVWSEMANGSHLDMLHAARRLWRGTRPVVAVPGIQSESCTLASLERALFVVGQSSWRPAAVAQSLENFRRCG